MLALSSVPESVKPSVTAYNWESNIERIDVEQCEALDDPLGYRAVFHLERDEDHTKSFAVGASFLAQRAANLFKAGYQAPMTEKAIALIEGRLGFALGSNGAVAA